ncbi:MAG: hemolysin D [Phycisphaerae bacterium]|nr:hemolysin D [Phycisphaerae bacterium]
MNEQQTSLFRREAVEHHASVGRSRGDLLRITPSWTRWTYWLLLLIVVGGLLYTVLGTVPEYAEGPAVIWRERTFVTATAAGTVAAIKVQAGDPVEAGHLLIHFHDAEELAEYKQLEHAYDLQLINNLRDPLDQATRQELKRLRTQRELAAARLDERCVRAPRAGMVGDIRIRAGQHFMPGDILLTLLPDDERDSDEQRRTRKSDATGTIGPRVVAMLPAHYGPLLEKDMIFRLELTGFPNIEAEAEIDSVGQAALGPGAIRRYLGTEIADAVSVQGPIVLVHARLKENEFEIDGKHCRFGHGMQGLAAISVRTERIVYTLIPGLKELPGDLMSGLKELFGDSDG